VLPAAPRHALHFMSLLHNCKRAKFSVLRAHR